MAEIIAGVDSKMKCHDKEGIKLKMIIDVDPSLLVMPQLHTKLVLINRDIIKLNGCNYTPWSNKIIENIPEEEQVIFN